MKQDIFTLFSNSAAKYSGHPVTFVCSVLVVFIWGATGPLFHFDNTWQLVINTSTTIISFWMVFLIQNSQNRDNLALHLKLDQLILSIENADNKFINLESLSETELEKMHENMRLK